MLFRDKTTGDFKQLIYIGGGIYLLPRQINLILVVLGSLWLVWLFSTRYSSEWTTTDWVYIGFIGFVVFASAYGLIKENKG